MSPTAYASVLLLLAVTAAPVFSQDGCTIFSTTASSITIFNYTMSVSNAANVYTVTVSSNTTRAQNVTVLLQATTNNNASGNWTSSLVGFQTCSIGYGISYNLTTNSSVVANWNIASVQNVTNITFNAFVNDSTVYKLQNIQTIAPTTITPAAAATTKSNGGHANHPATMLLAVIQILSLMTITSNLLS